MGREQTLLARIAGMSDRKGRRYVPTTEEDIDALMESVRMNLRRLLNARQGMSQAQPDYGLPALVDIAAGGKDYIQRVQDAVRLTIEKYEPRLRNVRVSPCEEESKSETLRFRVDAVLVGSSGTHRVWYETSLRVGGTFDVAG